jgi:peptidoglycan/LPS O-acetylase OafA/YrhL
VFGTYRYTLALLVVAFHVARWPAWSGPYAVFGFYVLSGFLMTSVIRRQYGTHPAGVSRYLANRALRIYPVYWCALALSVLLVEIIPTHVVGVAQRMPRSTTEWFYNMGIFGLTSDVSHRLVPPAWSLNVELVFYVAMPLLLSRSRITVVLWLIASVGYTLMIAYQKLPLPDRYYPIAAASLAFSIGATISSFGHRLTKIPAAALLVIAVVFLVNACLSDRIWTDPMMGGFYLSVVLSALLVWALKDNAARGWWARADRALGRLSYPIFLMHWNVAALANAVTGGQLGQGTLFVVSFVPLNAVAWVLSQYVERPIERLRGEVRKAAKSQSDADAPLRQSA